MTSLWVGDEKRLVHVLVGGLGEFILELENIQEDARLGKLITDTNCVYWALVARIGGRRWDEGLTNDTLAKRFVEIRHRELGAVGLDSPAFFLVGVCCGLVAEEFRRVRCQRVRVVGLRAPVVGELESADSLLVRIGRCIVLLERVVREFGA